MVRLKESLEILKENGYIKFQFLMVRLKVKASALLSLKKVISIPYGAIKSCSNVAITVIRQISIPYGAIKS